MAHKKLKTSSGATILLALLFFLLCALAGSVVLAAGTAAAGRISGLRQQEQSYYSVTSAALYLQEEIEGQVFSVYENLGDATAGQGYNQEPEGEMAALLKIAATWVYDNNETASEGAVFSDVLKVKVDTGSSDLKETAGNLETEAVFTMDKSYNISIEIRSAMEESRDQYKCTLKIPAAISMNGEQRKITIDGEETTQVTTTLTWTDGTIER